MKVLIAPINWGLGHAARCLPIIRQYRQDRAEVVLAGDGDSLLLLRQHFPDLRYIELPRLNLRYSKHKTQVWAMAKALPKIICWSIRDHYALASILELEHFDRIISDNRFGLYAPKPRKQRHKAKQVKTTANKITNTLGDMTTLGNKPKTECIYITHQMMIKMPAWLQWLEPFVHTIHRAIMMKYNVCWIPDYAGENNLSGDLSHQYKLMQNAIFVGPLSRFQDMPPQKASYQYQVVAVLSGLEPQRTLFEREIISKYANQTKRVLIIEGKPAEANVERQIKNITIKANISDEELASNLLGAEKIIARSGYSTIMDLAILGVLNKAYLTPTPGQTEQEYLYTLPYINHEQDNHK